MTINIIRLIAQKNLRVFSLGELSALAHENGYSSAYLPRLVSLMKQKGDLVSLGYGLYTLPLELLAGGALHEFEIALAIAKNGAISHYSAFSHYGLTDQILNRTYVTVPKIPGSNLSSTTMYPVAHNQYVLIRVAPKCYWGVKYIFISEARICITDIEKTLIDGLNYPQYCGGFFEVVNAFDIGINQCSPDRLLEYAQKTSLVVCKRLGWVLEKINQLKDLQVILESMPMGYAQRLNPTGIAACPELKDTLIFKGGTALKKCYFGNYRFSQDLDFSIRTNCETNYNLNELIEKSCIMATHMAQEATHENISFISQPYIEKRPHPEGQKAFTIQARLPWHRDYFTKVYIEISYQELVLLPPNLCPIIHSYAEELNASLYVYPLEEIVAEKIRALHQFAKKLHERGWGRSRVRDYYDLWRIFSDYRDALNLDLLPNLIKQKCFHKDVPFSSVNTIFQETLMNNARTEWQTWLSDVVPNLPEYEKVMYELKNFLSNVITEK
eukprot:gene24783-32275_t